MRTTTVLGALLAGVISVAFASSTQARDTTPPSFYFFVNESLDRSCAYLSRAAAQQAIDRMPDETPEQVQYVTTGRVYLGPDRAAVRVVTTVVPESGDWILDDDYRLRGTEAVSLRRTVKFASRQPTTTQIFERRGRRLSLRSTSPRLSKDDEIPDAARYADMRSAPFYRFVLKAAAAPAIPQSGFCVGSRPKR